MAQTLVFGWLADGDATLEELAQTAAVLHVEISPQALDQRFTQKTADFLLDLLRASVNEVVATQPVAIEILQRFNGVYLIDSSVIRLPDELAEIWDYRLRWQQRGEYRFCCQTSGRDRVSHRQSGLAPNCAMEKLRTKVQCFKTTRFRPVH